MDSNKPSSSPRKHRFAPKAPSQRRTRKSTTTKEISDGNDDTEAKLLLQRFDERGKSRQRSKAENKAQMQPTFIHGGAKRSIITRGSDVLQDEGLKHSQKSDLMDLDDSTKHPVSSLPAVGPSVTKKSSGDDQVLKTKEYEEPWNYTTTCYPTTLPWRRPYSGDPVILDEAEFGEAAMKSNYDEDSISSASELGFLNPEETGQERLLFFQLPPSLPVVKRSATAKGKEIEDSLGGGQKGPMTTNMGAKGSSTAGISQQSCSLEELPAGLMGKLLVYKSGAVKLKLGETLYDVSPGSDCSFAQDVVAFNPKEKECCSIGNLDKRAIVSLDAEYLLNSVIDLS
ncbi:uncharacterized protein LOC110717950 [Chenopodium quinoa]|uniref:Uncharacterized protein n=1 Tax=Chenopodium quinoa TaxID=63459 RepID=A0A803KT70_CHEQI|nr:uncharacterized protein LOC110717950 [Chenopodium quinoa]XP_021752442.1 uncharacterized protein LOC110717950 [Chenopodium quinoa]